MSAPISDAAPAGQSFADAVYSTPLGHITKPDDSVQVETGLFPENINPAIAAMQDEPGDVGE